jgi:hypothetical protein
MPLETIPFTLSGEQVMGDNARASYVGRHFILPTQFGVLRADVDTGRVIPRVGVAYPNSQLQRSDIGVYLIGDHNQSVNNAVANTEWIVTDCSAPIEGPDPAAVVWRNDTLMTFYGFVMQATGYYWNSHTSRGIFLQGDLLYVPNDRASYDAMDVRRKIWMSRNVIPPVVTKQTNIDGYTYAVTSPTGSATKYLLVRSGVSVEPPPVIEPSPVVTPPPTTEPLTLANHEVRILALEARMHAVDGK